MKKDLFISHASEDKEDFVRPLANLLKNYGLDVWYDEFELRIGASLSRSIDKGISNSSFGLLILSKAFFKKDWTEYELRSLNSFEVNNGDILLPIWKNVTPEEVREFSPYLADKFAISTLKHSIEDISLKIIEVVNPELFSSIHQKIAYEEALKNSKVEFKKASELKPGPIRHLELSENLISRIRLIRASLLICYPHTMEFWMDGFKRDFSIEREIRYWEHLSSRFLEFAFQFNFTEHHLRKESNPYTDLFYLLFNLTNLKDKSFERTFTEEFIEKVQETLSYELPIYELED